MHNTNLNQKINFKPSAAQYHCDEFEFEDNFYQVWYNCTPIINEYDNEDIDLEICGIKMHIGLNPNHDHWAIVALASQEFIDKFNKAFGDFVFDKMDWSDWNDIYEITPEPNNHPDY